MKEKKRLDLLLVERGLELSRERSQGLIMAGNVYVNGQKAVKPGQAVETTAQIEVKAKSIPFVSRGGLKLEKGLAEFNIDIHDKICIDVGASTGGFTHCMLLHGASKVYSVDVGYGQLAWELRKDARVICLERTNARYLTREQVPDELDFASVDVSFISLKLILPAVYPLLKDGGELIVLVKPQFEAGKERIGKKGVVRDPKVHEEVLRDILKAVEELRLSVCGLTFSPVQGPEGNIEFLYCLKKTDEPFRYDDCAIEKVVETAHQSFKE